MIHEKGCFITSYTLASYCRVCEAIRSTRTTALDAAREAVASLEPVAHIHRERALAAIDALREGR